MAVLHAKYLSSLEKASLKEKTSKHYLWPDTLIEDLQLQIKKQFGESDYNIENKNSRPARIIDQIKQLVDKKLIPKDFSVLDICCGDAIVLWQIKKAFSMANCYGVDFFKGKIGTHKMVKRDGVKLHRVLIQKLFRQHSKKTFDLAIMLNTYRSWKDAHLSKHDQKLPDLADEWFAKNARYVFLTAYWPQITHLKKIGFEVALLGKGEGTSTMICISRCGFPLKIRVFSLVIVPAIFAQKAFIHFLRFLNLQ